MTSTFSLCPRVAALIWITIAFAFSRLALVNAGTITNCTEVDFLNAVGAGGEVIFACNGAITIAHTVVISADTTLESAGTNVSIHGEVGTNGVRLFLVQPGVKFTIKNLSLANGSVKGA